MTSEVSYVPRLAAVTEFSRREKRPALLHAGGKQDTMKKRGSPLLRRLRIMALIDELKVKAVELTQAGVAKSKQLAEIARLSLANSGENDTIRKAYLEIGKLYYAERGMAPEAGYTALCEKITAAKINIEENKARIAQIKEEGRLKDSEVAAVETEIPPEEPVSPAGGGVSPADFADDDSQL